MRTLEEFQGDRRLKILELGEDGGFGILKLRDGGIATVVWSNGGGWDHVSVSPREKKRVPTWADMCDLKRIFFRPDEVAVEYHPAESEYVNFKTNCLHIWRPQNVEIPTPPRIFV